MRHARLLLTTVLSLSLAVLTGVPTEALPVRVTAASAGAAVAQALDPPKPAVAAPAEGAQVPPSRAKVSNITAHRVKELPELRSATMKRFRMSDGTVEAELSAGPVHFRDRAGKWQDIDTRVTVDDKPGYAFGNTKNAFGSHFGKRSDELVRFEADGHWISVGTTQAARGLAPTASGNTVTYPDVFGTADLRYHVSPRGLKEEIVVESVPATAEYTFRLRMGGVEAR